jgi:mono/diheme cytochrome c family protein
MRTIVAILLGFCLLGSMTYAANGRTVYTSYCQQCHGTGGEGDGPAGRYMDPKPRNFRRDRFKYGDTLEAVEHTIRDGVSTSAMPSFQSLPQDELEAVAAYVIGLRGQ